jgi:hypothetical protein
MLCIGEYTMKAVRWIAMLAVVASGLTLSAFAKDKNEAKFTLSDTAVLGSTQLKPGDYKAQWDGTGPDVQVKILKGKEVVASAPAKLIDKKNASGTNAVTFGTGNGARSLDEVDFNSGKQSLVFSGAATQAENMQH